MRRLLVALLVPAAAACGAAPPVAPTRPAAPIPVVQPTAAPVASPPPRAERPNRCLPNGPPKARVEKRIYSGDTCVDHRKVEAVLAKALAKQFSTSVKGSSVDVSFSCDPLTLGVEELVIESGSGHGGGLELRRLRRTKDDTAYELVTLAHRGYFSRDADAAPLIGHAMIEARAVNPALDRALAALTATVRELEPPPKPNSILGRSISMSSADLHLYFRATDGLHVLTRHFTGYRGTSGQSTYLGLHEAMDVVRPLLEKVQLEAREPTEDERDFFVESFLRASSRFEDQFAWWVRDRYVSMAEHLGTPELVPALAKVVENGLAEADKEADPTKKKQLLARRLDGPLAALARLTGWDPRKDDTGAVRDIDVVAKEVVDECTRGGS